jgi:ATP/ADP translocase
MTVMGVAYAIMGLSLVFQASRWHATPAYHNLLAIMPAQAWGGIFSAVAGLLAAGACHFRHRWLVIAALTAAIAVTTGWDLAFFVRWFTSPDTTPETWVSWAVFDYMLARAFMRMDLEEITLPRERSSG